MPWSSSEAKGHTKKADTPEKQRKWSRIANNALANAKSNGKSQSEAEGYAIRVANSAMGDHYWDGDVFDDDLWKTRTTTRFDAWSPEAREASIETRRSRRGGGARSTSSTSSHTAIQSRKRKTSKFEKQYHAGET